MARRGAGIDGRLCDVPPRRRHPRGAAGPHRRLALPHDLTGRSGAGSEVLHRRDESGRDRPRLAPTVRARTLERRGPRATEASPDSGLGLHEPRRPRREPGAGRGDREPRRPRPRGHVPRGHAARASIRDGRHPFGKGRVLPAEPLQAEGHPRRARRPPGAVRMKLRGRGIASGFAEGTAFVIRVPFSFVGGADPATGTVLDAATGGANERLDGRIFAFPHGKGSTVGSYVIYGLAKRGVGPAGIVNSAAEGIVAVGAILAGIPMVDRIDTAGLRTGDRIVLDGARGTVELPGVRAMPVVTAVLRNRGRILIVRRSEMVGSFRGRWSAISGHLEGREDAKARAVQEVREETGLRHLSFRAAGAPILARNDETVYVVHPFLFDVASRRVRLDWENVEHCWVRPGEDLDRLQTVPRLKDVVAAVLR